MCERATWCWKMSTKWPVFVRSREASAMDTERRIMTDRELVAAVKVELTAHERAMCELAKLLKEIEGEIAAARRAGQGD
jgi:hypothetical protein